MSDNTEKAIEQDNVRRLSAAILEVKTARADRDDVVHEIRDLQRARLDLLKQELQDVIEDVPEDETFDFAVSSGTQPRLWIDAVAYVAIGRDRRTYRFLRDTRAGRVVLAESEDVQPVADAVTRYVAERIVERKRQLEEPEESVVVQPSETPEQPKAVSELPERNRAGEALSGLALIIIGVLIGGATTLAVLRDRVPEITSVLGLN